MDPKVLVYKFMNDVQPKSLYVQSMQWCSSSGEVVELHRPIEHIKSMALVKHERPFTKDNK
jgi:hypothetical protein